MQAQGGHAKEGNIAEITLNTRDDGALIPVFEQRTQFGIDGLLVPPRRTHHA